MKRISYLILALGLAVSFGHANEQQPFKSNEKSICGGNDDRMPSTEARVARIRQESARAGCTVTMIGSSCAVSAGHCTTTFGIAEFNTPVSRNGRIQESDPEDVYNVDSESVVYNNGGQGKDWAVLRLQENEITGKLPGDVQGNYNVSFDSPAIGDMIRITGYGAADGADRNFAQQTHTGLIDNLTRSGILRHIADTMGGNSGSSILLEATQEIIGIHTHGGCWSRGGSNAGTLIAANTEFQEAITSCLQWEDDNL